MSGEIERKLEDIGRKVDTIMQLLASLQQSVAALAPRCPRCGKPMVSTIKTLYTYVLAWGVEDPVYGLVFECPECRTRLVLNIALTGR